MRVGVNTSLLRPSLVSRSLIDEFLSVRRICWADDKRSLNGRNRTKPRCSPRRNPQRLTCRDNLDMDGAQQSWRSLTQANSEYSARRCSLITASDA